jgi:ADP-dependent NAD(P)H-hydrate dehydratase / NAD(P)H-hydrate epimerase
MARPTVLSDLRALPPTVARPETLPLREFRRLDGNAEELGVPVQKLMDNAGKALAEAIVAMQPHGEVVLVCGKGNNGGDGYAAGGHLLDQGVEAHCVAVEPPSGGASRHFHEHLPKDAVESWRAFRKRRRDKPGLVVDCVLGSGIQGEARPPYDEVIHWFNRQRAPVVSCDVPSGMGTGLAVHPDATVTFHARKEGMTKENCGKIQVADIGIPARAARRIGWGDLLIGYPLPQRDSTKGRNGRLLVVGGGPFTGAPYYAGMAAYRTGVDLVLAAIPKAAADVVRTWGPELMVYDAGDAERLTPEGIEATLAAVAHVSAIVLGPGLGTAPETREAAQRLLEEAARHQVPVVVDADGLDALTPEYLRQNGRRTVLTPHGREFEDLAGRKPTAANVTKYAARNRAIVLRKGAVDIVSDGARTLECHRGHPTMTVGGTGDVLAGCVGALLAKGADPFEAACVGAYLVGVAGEHAAELWSWGATALDVAHAIPAVLRRLDG